MVNKMEYYVICDNGNFTVMRGKKLTDKDLENIVYGPCTAPTACLKCDELEEEYIKKHNLLDTRYYFEDMKYQSKTVKSLDESYEELDNLDN